MMLRYATSTTARRWMQSTRPFHTTASLANAQKQKSKPTFTAPPPGAAAAPGTKRPLDASQVAGSAAAATTASKAPATTPPPPSAAKALAPPPPARPSVDATAAAASGNDNSVLYAAAALAVLGGGGAYYYYSTQATATTASATQKQEETEPAGDVVAKKETAPATVAAVAEEAVETAAGPNKVSTIDMPATMRNTATATQDTQVTPTQHPTDGHRVHIAPPGPGPEPEHDTTDRALAALRSSVSAAAEEALLANHSTMWAATTVSTAKPGPFDDLDELAPAALKARIVQLATELSDRTRWEALRLKEFLAMKEQEVSNE